MNQPHRMKMRENKVIRLVCTGLIPFIILLGLYVQFHGDFGPGGGFQAGVIIAAGFVLYGLIYGLRELRATAPDQVVELLLAFGVLLYGGTGVATMLLGGNFLEYGLISDDPGHGQHYGLLFIECGVGITVTAAMLAIFVMFAGRKNAAQEEG